MEPDDEFKERIRRERRFAARLRLATERLEEAQRERIWANVEAHQSRLSVRQFGGSVSGAQRGLSVRLRGLSVRLCFWFHGRSVGGSVGGSVSDFVFGFTADPGHDLLEIIRKSRVASQARVDAARQVGDTVGPSEAEHGSQFMQRDLAVLAAEPGGGRSSDVRIAATRQSRTDQAEVITNRLEDGLRISCGQLTSSRKRWIRQDRPGQLPQPSDEPLRAQHPATGRRKAGQVRY